MPKLKLTARAIERLPAPDPSKKQKLYWDSELTGFGVLCSGTTATKTYIVQRDLSGGRTRRVTIAKTNVLDLEQATERAKGVLADFYKGSTRRPAGAASTPFAPRSPPTSRPAPTFGQGRPPTIATRWNAISSPLGVTPASRHHPRDG